MERWDGRRWSIQNTSNRRIKGVLSGVSCASRTACTAVGAVAERWNGKHWSIQNGTNLGAVSCPTTKTCIAVGSAGNKGLVERWLYRGR